MWNVFGQMLYQKGYKIAKESQFVSSNTIYFPQISQIIADYRFALAFICDNLRNLRETILHFNVKIAQNQDINLHFTLLLCDSFRKNSYLSFLYKLYEL